MRVNELPASAWAVRDEGAAWVSLYRGTPGASPFLSPLWIGTWLDTFGAMLRPALLLVGDGDVPFGACLLTRRVRRETLVPHVRLHINADGEPGADSVVTEHNDFLALPGREEDVAVAVARHVVASRADEVVGAGFTEAGVARLCAAFPGWPRDVTWRDSPYVDLDRLRAAGLDHLASLSRNARAQLRRSLERYRRRGPLRVQVATTATEGLSLLQELIALHEERWRQRGHRGAFATPMRRAFHEAFVREGVPAGAAQLLRVSAGEVTIGVIYSLVADRRVHFYQSGFRYEGDEAARPGIVSHHLAIMHNLAGGMAEYDFLVSGPGEGRYKRSLSDASRRLGWVTLYRPGWRTRWFDTLRTVRRWIGGRGVCCRGVAVRVARS